MKFKDFKKLDPEAGKYLSLAFRVGIVMLLSILIALAIGIYFTQRAGFSEAYLVIYVLAGLFVGFFYLSQELWKL